MDYREEKKVMTLKYLMPVVNKKGEIIRSGIDIDLGILQNELFCELSKEKIFDFELDAFEETSTNQISLKGSKEAYIELARALLSLAEYAEEDPNFHLHFDDVKNDVNLVIYAPHT